MYDLIVRNGSIVDGAGAPRYVADLGVTAGKIVEIGQIKGEARETIDATGLIVAPGFIDPHTHYDAQLCWDPLVTPSSWHGVTSVVVGYCGVGIAPCRPDDHSRSIATWDLVTVEGIPFEVLDKGIAWEWETFPQFMDAAEKRGMGVNVGFMAPLTPFRHWVMGEDSMERAATPEETGKIKTLVKEAVDAGALGFSTSTLSQHTGYKGRPLACLKASREELIAYSSALQELGKGSIAIALTKEPSVLGKNDYDLLDALLTASGRPITWMSLRDRSDNPEACQESLDFADPLTARGAVPQVASRPLIIEIDMAGPTALRRLACWQRVLALPDKAERRRTYADPDFRRAFAEELQGPGVFRGDWRVMVVHEASTPEVQALIGRSVASIAQERGRSGLDTFLDLAIEDDLDLKYLYEMMGAITEESVDRIGAMLADPRTMIGLSDGGAHVNMLSDAGYCTALLGVWVRDHKAMSLEYAVKRLTSEPAAFYGLHDRGVLAPGKAADIVVFDEATVGRPKPNEVWSDLPGGGSRMVALSEGVLHTIVNGVPLFSHGRHTGDLPGQVLRSRCSLHP